MTSGTPKAQWRKTRLLALALLALPTLATSADAGTDGRVDAAALVATLKRVAPARTAYTEIRFSGMLERPLILRGELEYLGRGKLGKRVDSPYRERLTIADGSANVVRGDHPPRTFALNQAPELEGFLRGFTALLGGDAVTLAQDFELSARGNDESWQLTLKPRDARLARRIAAIQVDGSGKSARCFRTRDADGDLNVTLVESLAATQVPARASQPLVDALCRGLKLP